MSKAEILEELPKLKPTERRAIRRKLDELDGVEWLDDGELTGPERRTILERLDACQKHPEKFVPWKEVEARLTARFGRGKQAK
jgi:hypothetical protein